jgi:hypothetical protein
MVWSYHLQATGRPTASAERREHAARAAGAEPDMLAAAAAQFVAVGRVAHALDLMREAAEQDPGTAANLLRTLIDAGLLDEAEQRLLERRERWPQLEWNWRLLAEVALRRGDAQVEREYLLGCRERNPSRKSTRMRLQELGDPDPCTDWLEEQRMDVARLIADYSDTGRRESVVSVLDQSAVWVFEDGSLESVTQNVHAARDLAACEQLGRLQLPGEVIEVATIDGRTGARSEPVLVGQEYVMPDLEPGDFVETTFRTTEAAPANDVLNLGGWFFASVEQAFALSRYVLSIPDTVELRREQANFERVTEERHAASGRSFYEFTAHDMSRVVPEPATAPRQQFLPWIEFGRDESLEHIVANMRAEAVWNSVPAPEIERAAERASAGAKGDEAVARALLRFVVDSVDQRAWQPVSPLETLLSRRGNPYFLYLALLRARDIPAELVWSRGVSPAADDEPEPRFRSYAYWRRVPLVRVQPRDGEEAWCDLSPEARLLPYGRMLGQFSRARAIATSSGEAIDTPQVPLEERPSFAFEGEFTLAADGSARVEGRVRPRGGLAWLLEESARKLPENETRANLRRAAASLVPGMSLTRYQLEGLNSDDEPLVIAAEGEVRTFLDQSSDGWVTRLPLPSLELSAQFAGQGRRRLPFRLPAPIVSLASVRLLLPPGLELVDPPRGLELECPGGSYRLTIEAVDKDTWLVEREVAIEVFDLAAEDFDAFRNFCSRVDEAERVRLRFRGR